MSHAVRVHISWRGQQLTHFTLTPQRRSVLLGKGGAFDLPDPSRALITWSPGGLALDVSHDIVSNATMEDGSVVAVRSISGDASAMALRCVLPRTVVANLDVADLHIECSSITADANTWFVGAGTLDYAFLNVLLLVMLGAVIIVMRFLTYDRDTISDWSTAPLKLPSFTRYSPPVAPAPVPPETKRPQTDDATLSVATSGEPAKKARPKPDPAHVGGVIGQLFDHGMLVGVSPSAIESALKGLTNSGTAALTGTAIRGGLVGFDTPSGGGGGDGERFKLGSNGVKRRATEAPGIGPIRKAASPSPTPNATHEVCDPHDPECSVRDLIRRVIHEQKNAIRYCYESHLNQLNQSGRVAVSFRVDETGAVSSAKATTSTFTSPVVADCLVERLKTWRFPKAKHGPYSVTYPFIFSMAGAGGP